MRFRSPFYLLIGLLLMPTVAGAQGGAAGITVIAEVDPPKAFVQSPVVYTLTISGNSDQPDSPQLPALDPATGLSAPNLVSMEQSGPNIVISNGRQVLGEVKFHYRYTINPSKEGTFTIPPAKITVGGRTYESNPVTLSVSRMSAAANVPSQLQGMVAPVLVPRNPQLQQKINGAVFVLPVVTNPNPFNGEQIRVSFHLVVDSEVLQREGLQVQRATIANPEPPGMDDFMKEELYVLQEGRPYRKQVIGGKTYDVLPLYEAAITSTKTGKLTVEPFKLSLLVGSNRRGARSQFPDPFEDEFSTLFGSGIGFGGLSSREELVVQSMPVEIDVKPLPSGKPTNFSGAVGDFSISATPDRDTAAANDDVIKVQVTLEGKGDTSSIAVPDLPKVPGMTVLGTPKSTQQGRKENDDYISTRKIDYLVRATQPGRLEIPAIPLSVFNPKTGEYQQLESNPVEVNITPGTRPAPPIQAATGTPAPGATPGTQAAGDKPAPQPEADLRYIHTGDLQPVGTGMLGNGLGLFVVLASITPAVLLAGFLVGRRSKVTTGEARTRRQKRALEMAQRHLRESEKLLHGDDRSQFFNELSRNLRGYFGDKFGLEAGSLTIGQIEEELRARNASDETISLAERLLEQCDAARYSPVQPDREVARQAYDGAADLLRRVEQGQ